MKPSLTRLLSPQSAALDHLESMADAFEQSVDVLAQLFGASHDAAEELDTQLGALDSRATSLHMALLTSLRSAFVTPLPRQDLYLISNGLNRAIERTCLVGSIIHQSRSYRLPTTAMDALEILDRQSDLLKAATAQLTDFDQLEVTWIQLERLGHRAERVLLSWRLQDASELLARHYYRQREVALGLGDAFEAVRQVIVALGQVLVRES